MIRELLIQYLPSLFYLTISLTLSISAYYFKRFINSHSELLIYQKQQLIQKIGIDKYNHEVEVAKGIIKSVEQLGKEFDWAGEIKHAKATKIISQRTGLSQEEISDLIKSTVSEFKK